ncbi:TPA: spondin domain-containing protein [Elizabethkingia anophelis]
MKIKPTSYLLIAISIFFVYSCSTRNEEDTVMPVAQKGIITIENIVNIKDFVQSDFFQGPKNLPVFPPVQPGESVRIKFNATKGQHLMFVTKFNRSKDLFFAPSNPGIKLFKDNGTPVLGDVSDQIKLWDNGSKDNLTNSKEENTVSEVTNINAGEYMELQLGYDGSTSEFTLTITNRSISAGSETSFSPGVWAVSNIIDGTLLNKAPFYQPGEKSSAEMRSVAERGDHVALAEKIKNNTGIITTLSPLVVVVYRGNINPFFKIGDENSALKEFAQYGSVTKLKDYLRADSGVKSIYIAGTDQLKPGEKASVNITTQPGDKIAYATKFGYSNDWFYTNSNELSADKKGVLTYDTSLFDSGTSQDQYPGAGNNQALLGNESPHAQLYTEKIKKVDNTFPVPDVPQILKITYE